MKTLEDIVICGEDSLAYEGKFLSQVKRPYRGTDGVVRTYEITVRNTVHGIVSGLPVTSDGDFLINRQFRIPLGQYVYENTAGLVDSGETKEQAMMRELREETWYTARGLQYVGRVPTSSGLTDEIVDCFVLLGAEKTGNPHPEASESIETLLVRDDEMDAWFLRESQKGHLIDPKIMMLVGYYRTWLRNTLSKEPK